jgi:hypothetical protein
MVDGMLSGRYMQADKTTLPQSLELRDNKHVLGVLLLAAILSMTGRQVVAA